MVERLAHRRRQLEGMSAVLQLPLDQQRPALPGGLRGSHRVDLPAPLSRALAELGQRHGVDLEAVLLAGVLVLLRRYTGQETLLLGATLGRPDAQLALLGADLRGDPTVAELLRRTQRALAEAREHADLPAEALVEALRRDGHVAVPQVRFGFHDGDGATPAAGDLAVLAQRAHDRLCLVIDYDTELFEPATAARLSGHLAAVLAALPADSERRIDTLPLLTPDEERRLLVEWNATGDGPGRLTVHEMFQRQAAGHPLRVAVSFDSRQLTYGELDRRANQLARHLRALGVGLEGMVGLCVERSPEMVVGLLGILKAGGAYVPLDPRHPDERQRTLIRDAGIRVVLTQERLLPSVRGLARTVCLDRDWPRIARQADTDPASGACPDSAAYVAYTSGSTGVPKGACVPHRAVTRLVVGPNYLSITADDVFLQLAPLAFDASTLEIWAPLLNGARLVVFPPHDPSLGELAELLEREGITTLWLTSGLFHQMVEEAIHGLRDLRQLLAGGDVLSVSHVNRLLAEAPGLRLINGYGPTENTTFTCCHTVRGPVRASSVPIGRPISATRVYVLDRNLRPVPAGVPGELCAGGQGVARCYLNRPALTAERFVPDPFASRPGARMYRTGDLARWLPDGTIEFLGRLDNQVKVRGFRIEPGEVETAIMRHPEVKDAVVTAHEHATAGKRLVAFVVPARQRAGLALALRRQLAESLPPYAVPSSFVLLDELPLNANGKVDRAALRPPRQQSRPETSDEFQAPRTPLEEELAALWSELLEIAEVGVHDDFFELGGHSLVATRITAEITDAYGIEVPPTAFYLRPTVAGLAEIIEELRRAPSAARRPEEAVTS
jgi:amino acid adenylation domain-containing protein